MTTSYPLARGSSGGIFVARLVRELGRYYEVTVVTPAAAVPADVSGPERIITARYAPRSLQTLAHRAGGIPVQLRRYPLSWLLVPFLLAGLAITLLYRGRWADVIHANWAISALPAALTGRLWGRPVVTTLRGDDVAGALQRRAPRWIMRFALRESARVVVVSASMREQLINAFPAMQDKIVFIPNGVEIARRLACGHPRGRRLLAVGSLIKRKQINAILSALVHLPEAYTLTVVGEGPEGAVLARLAQRVGVAARVTWAGPCAPEKIGEVYASHDLLVHPARSEGRPNVVVEALAAGLPVVGADIPGVREILEESAGGELVPVGDDSALAMAIHGLLESPEKWAACAAAGPLWVEQQQLSWRACAQRYAALFEMVRAR